MRFFSNDSKDSDDDRHDVDVQERADEVSPPQAHNDDLPDHVQSDPVSVPQQRSGSPWSSAPDNADAELSEEERRDGTVDTVANGHDDDANRPPFHEPAPQPTAFGASTPGGAVAASAMANPENDTWQATDRDSAADSGVGDDRTVAPGDGVVADPDDRLRPDETEVRHDGDAFGPLSETSGTRDTTEGSHRLDPVDLPLDDDSGHRVEDPTPSDTSLTGTGTADTTRYGPDGTVTASGDTSTDADATDDGNPALKDEGGFDDPKVVDPTTDEPLDRSSSDAAVPVAAAGAAATAAAALDDTGADRKPGSVTEQALGSLFGRDDAQGFHDRWRDVQLRFVDSPKDATAEAARLVDEAVDKLTASLKAQKGTLSSGSEDTEKLRIELRGYRDLLNRLLDL